jgi:biofilm PGA synthesis protein PgaD
MIIEVPEQLSRVRRVQDAGLTAVAAILWLVALQPLLLLGLWYLAVHVFHTHMVKLEGWKNPDFFATLGIVAAGLTASLLAWSRYNALRFRRTERRTLQPAASEEALPARFALSPGEVARLRDSRRLQIDRPQRFEVVITLPDGFRLRAHHDPLGPRPDRGAREKLELRGGDRGDDRMASCS